MTRLSWLLVICLAALLVGCGGGGNDEADQPIVRLGATVSGSQDGGQFLEVEMVKNVTSSTGVMTLSGLNLSNVTSGISRGVGTIEVQRYELTYQRLDGGSPSLDSVSGDIGVLVGVPNSASDAPTSLEYEFVVMSSTQKLFSAFAQAFRSNPVPVEFQATLRLFSRNLSGDSLPVRETTFRFQTAVFEPTAELAPEIASFTQSPELIVGQDYNAAWTVLTSVFPVTSGLLQTPWGQQLFLDASNFPAGSASVNSAIAANQIPIGQTIDFPSGILFASNPFGTAQQSGSDDISITRPEVPISSAPPLTIDRFISDRTEISLGETVSLTWSISGGADRIKIFPDTYNGVTVDFTGKDLAFDSITIQPDFSVRPLLRAERNDGAVAEFLMEEMIEVRSTTAPNPEIALFQVNRSSVQRAQQVVFFWETTGNVRRVEIFPINGSRVDVTGQNTFLSPPLNSLGDNTFTLVAEGADGSIAFRNVTVNVSENLNEPVDLTLETQVPGTSIPNGAGGAFTFRIDDPEGADSSWRCVKIAGDTATFFPNSGRIPGGKGDDTVAFDDKNGNSAGFITFEVSAFDDDFFGFTPNATRSIIFVTFNTTGTLSESAPTIQNVDFVPSAADGTGVEGVLTFSFSDPDDLNLRWSVQIVDGDFGGSLDPAAGTVNTGSGEISVNYEDDPDTPFAPVVFLVRVVERNETNPQQDIQLFRLDKATGGSGTGGGTGGGGTGGAAVSFVFDGLYKNLFGGVSAADEIQDFILYSNGNLTTPQFFRRADLSETVDAASAVFDLAHGSGDPSNVTGVNFSRDFAIPSNALQNSGSLTLNNYYPSPGQPSGGSPTTIQNGVGRYFMSFNAESFRESSSDPFNLPTVGSRDYDITVTANENGGSQATFLKVLRVIVP